jgi:hypothetical protein
MDVTRRVVEEGIGTREWWGLGTSRLGARVVATARLAAALHEAALVREAAACEGVGIEERLALLEGAD